MLKTSVKSIEQKAFEHKSVEQSLKVRRSKREKEDQAMYIRVANLMSKLPK